MVYQTRKKAMTVVAIDVDAQCTFSPLCPHELPVPDGHLIVDELNAQAQYAKLRVLTKDAHNPQALWVANDSQAPLSPLPYPNADLAWPRHAEVGSDGFAALPGLPKPTEYDFLVYKGVEVDLHPYGACYHDLGNTISTGLIEWLVVNQAQHILIGGLATDYCVKNTVLQLCHSPLATWQVWVNLAACRGIAPDTIATATTEMQNAGAKIINSSADLAAHFSTLSTKE